LPLTLRVRDEFSTYCAVRNLETRSIIRPLLRLSLLLAAALSVVPLSGVATASKPSLSNWTKAKHGKVLTPAKAPPPASAPKPAVASAASKSKAKPDGAGTSKAKPDSPVLAKTKSDSAAGSKAKSEGGSVGGRVAVFGFTGDGAARVQQVVVNTLRMRGMQVMTSLRPVDSAEQYRDMAATLGLAAYIDGRVGSGGAGGRATVQVRSGVSGRRIASLSFSGDHGALTADVGDRLWPKMGPQLTRLCAEAAKPHKAARRAMRIDAGSPLGASAPDDYLPPHLRNEPPKGRQKDDPWADEP
jgi:hypothetical protein